MDEEEQVELIERLVESLERIADSLEQIAEAQTRTEKRARKKNSP